MKYIKLIGVILAQALMFYGLPTVPFEPIVLIGALNLGVLILSVVTGILCETKLKYLYPLIISATFLSTLFIYYNESASVYGLWFLLVSIVGLVVGSNKEETPKD